ncbi:hypothetical protein PGB90_007081 [Kerria lacca]
MAEDDRICYFCSKSDAKYTCPKCCVLFCSQLCYQSESHLHCSEQFYKECVEEELKLENIDPEQKAHMLEILNRHRNQVEAEEIENDSDDEESISDLNERLENVDLNDADEIWNCLTEQEKLEFNAIISSGEITHLIPKYEPWYEKKIEEIESHLSNESKKYKEKCPPILPVISFSSISKTEPSSCILWNIVNVLAAYAFTVRRYIGEHHNLGAANTILYLSTNLNSNQNFESKETAIVSVVFHANNNTAIMCSEEDAVILHDDIRKLLAGPESCETEFYILSALSDLQRLFSSASNNKKKTKKNSDFSKKYPDSVEIVEKQKIRKSIKKLTFYMSWINEFYKKNVSVIF